MGTVLLPAVQVRSAIEKLVKSGAITEEELARPIRRWRIPIAIAIAVGGDQRIEVLQRQCLIQQLGLVHGRRQR